MTERDKPSETIHITEVEVVETPVWYAVSERGLETILETQAKIEAAVSLKRRKCYGVFFRETGEYRSAVSVLEDDHDFIIGLEKGLLSGGFYARVKLQNPHAIPNIGDEIRKSAQAVEEKYKHDPTRPDIEFYRSEGDLHLLFPIVK